MTELEQPLAGVPALVLGAGFGTRLRPLTEHIPKPVIPLLGRPLIGHPLIHLYAAGCTQVHINAFHHSKRLMTAMDAWVQRRLLKMGLHWSIEAPAILGTGAIEKRVVVVSDPETGTDVMAIRKRCLFSLAYDHRIVDGADSARFLSALKEMLESFPEDA